MTTAYSGCEGTFGGSNKHCMSSTHTCGEGIYLPSTRAYCVPYMYKLYILPVISAIKSLVVLATGQLSVELTKSKVPSGRQGMLKVDLERSDSQNRL